MKKHTIFFSKTFLLCAGALALSAGTVSAVSPKDVYNDQEINEQWQWFPELGGINIADVWESGITGKGVVIGIVDEWVEHEHKDLFVSAYNPARDWASADLSLGLSYDFANPGFVPAQGEQPYPNNGHGTACAGMAAAVGGNDIGVVGAAPGAMIAGLNITSEGGGMQFSNAAKLWGSGVSAEFTDEGDIVMDSVVYLGDPLIGVKNCSFGSSFGGEDDDDGVKISTANNVIYCLAAGNERHQTDRPDFDPNEDDPGPSNTGWGTDTNNPCYIVVASMEKTPEDRTGGCYSTFSSYGAGVFISAPGTRVYGTDRTGTLGYGKYGQGGDDCNYTFWDGTSAATPLVAGVVALGKEIHPDMDVRWAKHALARSSGYGADPNIDSGNEGNPVDVALDNPSTGYWAKNNGGYWFNNNYGFGLVDPVNFVDQTRKILYTTVETELSLEGAENIEKVEETEIEGTVFGFAHSDELSQDIESISVSVEFSEEAVANMDVRNLKVTLYAPDYDPEDAKNGDLSSSVLVQGSVGDVGIALGEYLELEGRWGYTFLTNAFWGASYEPESGDWLIGIEYDDGYGVDTSDWFTVSSVDFRLGEAGYEDEDSVHEIVSGTTVELDTIAVDLGMLTIAGTAQLEDSVFVNGGKFVLAESGVIEAYTEGVFGDTKGVKYVQTGGSSEFNGEATFARGVFLSGGNMTLFNSIDSGSEMTISGGTLTIEKSVDGDAISVGDTLLASGGEIILSEGASFETEINAAGASVEMQNGSSASEISIGRNTSGEVGTFSASGSVTVSEGLRFSGGAVGTFAKDAKLSGGAVTLTNGTLSWEGRLTVDGGIKVASGTFETKGVGSYNGALENTGTLSVASGSHVAFGQDSVWSGNGSFNVAGTLELQGVRRVANAMNGVGNVVLASGSEVSFDRSFGARVLEVQKDAVLKGPLSMVENTASSMSFYAAKSSQVLLLDGTLDLAVSAGESVDLGGGSVKLGSTAKLVLSDATLPKDKKVSIFENGTISSGNIKDFLLSNDEIKKLSQTQVIFYSDALGLSVQIVEGSHTAVVKMEMPEGTESALTAIVGDWSAIQSPGLYGDNSDIDINDPLVSAMLSDSSAAREIALNVLPVNYAAMVAMTTAGYHSDVQSVSDRVEQRRYDAYSDETLTEFFIQATGTSMNAKKGDSDGVTFDYETYGLFAGADYKLSPITLVGFSVAAEGGEAKLHGNGGKLEMSDFRATGFFGQTIGERSYITGGVHVGEANFDIRRRTVYGDPRGEAKTWDAGAFVEAGTLVSLSEDLALTPYIGLSYLHTWVEDFKETGHSAMWNVDSFDADSLRIRIGADLSYAMSETCRLSLGLAYAHDFMGEDVDIDATRLSDGMSLPRVKAKTMATDIFSISPGVDFALTEASSVYAKYTFSADSDSGTSHSANIGFRMRF